MSQIEVDKVIPQSGTALQVGESGDTITIPAGATITNNGTATGFDTDTNDKVKVSSNDTTAGFLNGKLVAGTNISLTEGSDGGNETLTAAFTGNLNASVINAGTIATARLGSGTANSSTFLRGDQTYAAISSDFVLLSSTTPSPANTFSIDGFFTSDYDIYKIYSIGMSGSSMSNTRLSYKMNVSGSAVTGYVFSTANQSGTTFANWADNTNATSIDAGYVHSSSGSTAQGNLEMLIYRPLSTDQTTIITQMTAWDNGTTFGRYFGASADKTARAISGITLGVGAFGSGNIEADRILVYGMKNS